MSSDQQFGGKQSFADAEMHPCALSGHCTTHDAYRSSQKIRLTITLYSTTAHATQDPKVTADRAFNGFGTNFENSPEPIYGAQFLPRKFKIAVTVPGVLDGVYLSLISIAFYRSSIVVRMACTTREHVQHVDTRRHNNGGSPIDLADLHFKVCAAWCTKQGLFDCFCLAGDNSVDLFTQDLGLVVITNDAGELQV